jgi:hypothetical protein
MELPKESPTEVAVVILILGIPSLLKALPQLLD